MNWVRHIATLSVGCLGVLGLVSFAKTGEPQEAAASTVMLGGSLLALVRFAPGWLVSSAAMSGVVSFHATSILSVEPSSACSCLSGIGSPSHAVLLATASAILLLLILARPRQPDGARGTRPVSVAMMLLACGIGILLAWPSDGVEAPASTVEDRSDSPRIAEDRPGLRGQNADPGPETVETPKGSADSLDGEWSIRVEFPGSFKGVQVEIGAVESASVAGELLYWGTVPEAGVVELSGSAAPEDPLPTRLVVSATSHVSSSHDLEWRLASTGAARAVVRVSPGAPGEYRGRVVDLSGDPVSGLHLLAQFDRSDSSLYFRPGDRIAGSLRNNRRYAHVQTDAAGNFTIVGALPSSFIYLSSPTPRWQIIGHATARHFRLGIPDPPDQSTPTFVALHTLWSIVPTSPAQRAAGAKVDVAPIQLPEGVVRASTGVRLAVRKSLPDGAMVVGRYWTTANRARELLGRPFQSVTVSALGYEDQSTRAVFWQPAQPTLAPVPARTLLAGESADIQLRLTGDDVFTLPTGESVWLQLAHRAAPNVVRLVQFRSTAPNLLQSSQPLPPGVYRVGRSVWVRDSQEVEAGTQVDVEFVKQDEMRILHVSAAFPDYSSWLDYGLTISSSAGGLPLPSGSTAKHVFLQGEDASLVLRTTSPDGKTLGYYFHEPGIGADLALELIGHGPGVPDVKKSIVLRPGRPQAVDLAPWPKK